jgi:SAM-dependent methyltransferase
MQNDDRSHYSLERKYWDLRGQEEYTSLSESDQVRLTDWIGWTGHGRVLDIGGGSGMVSRLLNRKDNTECVCVDISRKMLSHASVHAVQADALKLPFADQSFDLIIAAAFVHHVPGKEPIMLHECHRVLKQGGRMVGYDPNARCIQNRVFMTSSPLRLDFFSPDERPVMPANLQRAANDAGFSGFRYRTFSFRNPRLTKFELIQRYVLNPFSVGPLRNYLDRWFFWEMLRE